jgi:hypothetical protein
VASPELSLILVTHCSSAVVPEAVAAFRRQARALGLAAELVLVDHSEDSAEAERLAALVPDQLLTPPNRGYAAGLNAGIAVASGRRLLLANPDVVLDDGALAALLAALDAGWHLVGPQFHLGGFLFPPAEPQTPGAELRRLVAARSRRAWRRLLAREVRRSLRLWRSTAPLEQPLLSGALLAMPAAVAARVGPWPEEYFLYFEEADWLARARRLGLRLGQVPAARARHAWGHAAGAGSEVYAASRRRYYRRRHGPLGRLLAAVSSPPPPPLAPLPAAEELPSSRELLWLVSPAPLGLPAAGAWGLTHPAAVLRRFAAARSHPGPLAVTAYQPVAARIAGRWQWAAPPVAGGVDA